MQTRARTPFIFLTLLLLVLTGCADQETAPDGDATGGAEATTTATAGPDQASGEPIKIGAVLSLSGPVAPLGEDGERGIQMAVEEINANGGIDGRPLDVEVLDDQSQQDTASSAGQRLISQSGVTALLGGSFGSTANALGALAEREQVPLITPTGIVVDEQREWGYSFFTLANFEHVSDALLGHAEQQGYERIGLLRLSREYGEIGSRFVNQLAPDHGVEIVAEEQGADGDSDFTSQLTNIRSADPDALIVWFANPAGATILQNMQQLGMDLPVLAPLSMANQPLIDIAGEAAEGVVVQAQLAPAEPLPRQEDFVSNFEEQSGELPETFNAVGYDLVQILAEALRNVEDPSDREQVRDALEEVSYEGAGTIVEYGPDSHEPPAEAIVLTEVVDGRFVQAG